jgi:D-xylose 1-dehydrogenase (NADP+, D-xylono-1,5-lactone-forming)
MKADEVAKRFGIQRVHGSYENLLADPEIDAVYVPLPNSLHSVWTILACRVGKHVLCEKPLATNVAECAEMTKAAEANGVLLMEGMTYQFHPQFARCREIIASGKIGAVRLVRAAFTFPHSDPSNIRRQPELGGGVLLDAGCYCVSALRFVTQREPSEVFAFADFDPKTGIDETMSGILRFHGGVLGALDCSFAAQFRQSVEIVGSEGKIELTSPFIAGHDDVAIVVRCGDVVESIRVAGADAYRLMFDHFNECIATGRRPEYSPADSTRNIAVTEALQKSAREKHPICL